MKRQIEERHGIPCTCDAKCNPHWVGELRQAAWHSNWIDMLFEDGGFYHEGVDVSVVPAPDYSILTVWDIQKQIQRLVREMANEAH